MIILALEIIYLASLKSIHTIRWINYFANLRNSNINCISFDKKAQKINPNIKLYQLKGSRFLRNIIKSIRLLNSNKKSIVHVHYLGWNSLFLLFVNKKKVIILTPWGCDLYENKKNFFKRLWLKFIFSKCSYIICDSKKLLSAAYDLGYKNNKSKIIAFGTNTEEYKSINEAFLIKKNQPYIKVGTNRNMENIYDPLTFLKAANHLKRKCKNIKFFIANDGPLKKEIENYIKLNKLKSIIKLVGKKYGQENIKFYNSLDIYVSTSLRDGGLSASIAEAMSCERLVIVTDNSDNSKFIKHGYTGFIFKNRDYIELANLIESASINTLKARKIANSGRTVILKKCNYHKEMQKVNLLYKKLTK